MTLKMSSTQTVETFVFNNSSFQNYPHQDNPTIETTGNTGFEPTC